MFTQQLTLENLHRNVPSIFTNGKAQRTSDKYQPISTIKIVEGLKTEGFLPTWATQCR